MVIFPDKLLFLATFDLMWKTRVDLPKTGYFTVKLFTGVPLAHIS